jgi:hypothetical protein
VGWQLTRAETEAILHAISMRQRIHFLIATLFCCAAASAQVERLPLELKISDTDLASCYETATGKVIGSQLVRSHFFVAPSGRYRAYVEVESVASKSKTSSNWDCSSTSRLFVAAADQPFRQVLVIEPTPEAQGNSLGIVDWSPDGRTLLIAQGLFQWGSDFGVSFVRLYNAESGVISEPELVDAAFSARAGTSCAVVIQPLGFSEYSQVVLKASPFFMMGEEKPEENSCVQRESMWLFDPGTQELVPLSGEFKVQRYGKFEALSAKRHSG